MKSKKKELLWSAMIGLAGVIYILINTFMVSVADKNILDFLVTTMLVPAIALVICGMIMGRKNTLLQALPYLLIVTIALFGASIVSMFYMYHTGYVFEMLNNTKTTGNVMLDINDSITFGTVVQQGLICLVCACVGNGIGSKTAGALSKIRN